MIRTFGGFIGWETNHSLTHPNAAHINAGRFAFDLIASEVRIDNIYVPRFICDTILKTLKRLNIKYYFYDINSKFELISEPSLGENDFLLLVNFFGLKEDYISQVADKHKNVILDNVQSFFSKLPENIYAFNSARKFFPVPDGAFVSKVKLKLVDGPSDTPSIKHLELKTRFSSQSAYQYFLHHEASIDHEGLKTMSKLSSTFLYYADMALVKRQRQSNFDLLHAAFNNLNLLQLTRGQQTPLCYPLFIKEGNLLRERLIQQEIFTPQYWTEVKSRSFPQSFEYQAAQEIVCLPIDQRYDSSEISEMIQRVQQCL